MSESELDWRVRMAKLSGPGCFSGICFGTWIRLLVRNGFDIDSPYWRRFVVTSLFGLQNSMIRPVENAIYGRSVRRTVCEPPLFILGMFRSGTSYLHNLLALDDRFAYPNFFDVYFPHTFLCTQNLYSRMFKSFVPATRPQDQLVMAEGSPEEDELALCGLLGRSNNLDLAFPRQSDLNRKYFTLRDLSPAERKQWMSSLKWFVQKLTYKYRKPLVLKSPAHTSRIKTLLEIFPDARFIHIHRNPYEVFQSWYTMVRRISPWWQFQRFSLDSCDDDILKLYALIYDAFLEDRSLIPDDRFVQISYEDLCKDAVGQMNTIYRHLKLPDFEYVRPMVSRYVKPEYKRNSNQNIDPATRERVARLWERFFVEWGYPL